MTAFSLAGQTALITGGGSGIGLGIAECFVAAGARVVLAGRREKQLEDAAKGLGPAATHEVFDVTQTDGAADFVARVEGRVGPITILVNNAGINIKKPAAQTTDAELLNMLQTHVTGSFALTRALIPGMLERRSGNVVFIASMASLIGVPLISAYSAAKAAVLGLVRSLTVELSPQGIRVNAIAPGWIDTQMVRQAVESDPARKAKILGRTPVGRLGQPTDIGWAAVYLCSKEAQYVTGVVLPVDGGASIGF